MKTITKIRQFVPSDYCLACRNCCRFSQRYSIWVPHLLAEDVESLSKKNVELSRAALHGRIKAVSSGRGEAFICHFLKEEDNRCKIYEVRPFECRLYPLLLNRYKGGVFLAVDLNCPYVEENFKTKEFTEYTEYLADLLNNNAFQSTLRKNPKVIHRYKKVHNILRLEV